MARLNINNYSKIFPCYNVGPVEAKFETYFTNVLHKTFHFAPSTHPFCTASNISLKLDKMFFDTNKEQFYIIATYHSSKI